MNRPDGLTEDELLAHMRGQTDADTAGRIEAQADADPNLRAELALMGELRGALSQGTSAAPGGWDRLAAEIERTVPAAQPHRPVWRIAALFLGAVVLVQGAFLVVGNTPGDAPLYRTVSETPADATLAVAFGSETTAAEIAALLGDTGANIVDGPSALGFYRLAFPDAATQEAARIELETSSLVEIIAWE